MITTEGREGARKGLEKAFCVAFEWLARLSSINHKL